MRPSVTIRVIKKKLKTYKISIEIFKKISLGNCTLEEVAALRRKIEDLNLLISIY